MNRIHSTGQFLSEKIGCCRQTKCFIINASRTHYCNRLGNQHRGPLSTSPTQKQFFSIPKFIPGCPRTWRTVMTWLGRGRPYQESIVGFSKIRSKITSSGKGTKKIYRVQPLEEHPCVLSGMFLGRSRRDSSSRQTFNAITFTFCKKKLSGEKKTQKRQRKNQDPLLKMFIEAPYFSNKENDESRRHEAGEQLCRRPDTKSQVL